MIKIYQGGSTGLEQQKAKRYPSKINSGIKKSIKDSLQKDFNFELVLVQCGYFFEAIEEGEIFFK